MGTEVQLERQRYMPGYCSARDLGEDVSSNTWNYYEQQFQGATLDFYSENDKDGLKQMMLEHDAMFRKQVSELHRLYRTQRDLMEEMKRSELHNHHMPFRNPLVYQRQDSTKMHAPIFPSSNSASTSPSILGAEHSSPNLSHLKRKNPKTDFLSANDVDGFTDCEIIECRPGKVRRKMFDLELPADEHILPVDLDQSRDEKARCPSFPNSCYNGQSFFGGRSMISSRGNGCRPSSELTQIQDDPPTLDLLNHGTLRNNLGTDSLSLRTPPKYNSRGTSAISCYGGDYIDSRKAHLADRESNSAQASHQLSLGKFNTKDSSLSQYLQRPEISLESSRQIHGRNSTLHGTSFPDSKEGFWNDRMVAYEPVSGTQLYGTNRTSDVNSWSRPIASWENYSCNSAQKQPYFISSVGLSKGSQASNQPSKPAEGRFNINSGYVVGIPRRDLDHGSLSGSKEDSICYPSVKFENLDSCRDGLKYSKGLNSFDLNSSEGINLNAAVANDSLHEIALHQNLVVSNRMERSGKAALLPWLKPKHLISDTARANCSTDHNSKMINGFPEFAQPLAVGSLRPSKGGKSDMKQIRQVFDMNLPGETDANLENTSADEIADTKVTGFKNLFDLNSCLTEDEPSTHSASSVARNIKGIDLEAPAPVDFDEDIAFAMMKQTQQEAEFEHVAAEAIFSFSSLKKSCSMERAYTATETLKWFVGVISSHPSEVSEEQKARTSSDDIDDFELMTLKLTEMSAEESMPQTAFPPILNLEEEEELTTALIGARPRRGQARRGRPKRDFQRDILPGIASLSRHEVTEDFQAFDGLMRAGGHSWQFGKRAAARNKPRRGRPRTVNLAPVPDPIIYSPPAQPTTSCVEPGMKESNLTSWGKTTRRPRRQRCPAGNPQPIRLS